MADEPGVGSDPEPVMDNSPSPQRKARPQSLTPETLKSMNPYVAQALSPKSKSGHIATVKSLGMLHELQEYIASVEALAAAHKQELERVKEEKRDVEKAIYKMELGGDRTVVDFTSAAVSDMPPKLRAVFEENKVMKEKLRKYKSTTYAMDAELTKRQNQILSMEDQIAGLKQQLQACSRTPSDVETEEGLKRQLEESERRNKNLEHESRVLSQKIATDAKLARQALRSAEREKEALKQRLVLAQADVEGKDKELRAAMLDLRRLSKRLAPIRGAPPTTLAPANGYGADHAAHQRGGHEEEEGATGAQHEDVAGGVHVMVLVVREEVAVVAQGPPSPQVVLQYGGPPSPEPPPESQHEHKPEPTAAPEPEPEPAASAEEAAPEAAAAAEEPAEAAPASEEAPAAEEPPPEPAEPEATTLTPTPPKDPQSHLSAPKAVPYSRTAQRADRKKPEGAAAGKGTSSGKASPAGSSAGSKGNSRRTSAVHADPPVASSSPVPPATVEESAAEAAPGTSAEGGEEAGAPAAEQSGSGDPPEPSGEGQEPAAAEAEASGAAPPEGGEEVGGEPSGAPEEAAAAPGEEATAEEASASPAGDAAEPDAAPAAEEGGDGGEAAGEAAAAAGEEAAGEEEAAG